MAQDREGSVEESVDNEEVQEQVTTEEEQAATPEEQIEAARKQAETYLEELKRERASFINYRRRIEQERQNWTRESNAALIFNILPVLDDFARAQQMVPEDQKDSPWVEGIGAVGRKLYTTLELAGLKEIHAVGEHFDPNLHEAVSMEESPEYEHQTVIEEYRKGYMIGDRVLRPSMVKVAQ